MRVAFLKIKDKHKGIQAKEKISLEINRGIIGDMYASGGSKQVSILSLNSRKLIDKNDYKGLCTKRFQENVTIENLNVKEFKIGDRIKISSSIIEITSTKKKCHKECFLYKNGRKCPLIDNVIFARVIKSGEISLQDKISPLS